MQFTEETKTEIVKEEIKTQVSLDDRIKSTFEFLKKSTWTQRTNVHNYFENGKKFETSKLSSFYYGILKYKIKQKIVQKNFIMKKIIKYYQSK
jgi:hypothetical protein